MNSNALEKELTQIAETMPIVCQLTYEKQKVEGRILIWQGMKETLEGERILPKMVYEQDFPVVMAINHKRRMLQAYRTGGQEKLLEYIDTVTEMYESQALITD